MTAVTESLPQSAYTAPNPRSEALRKLQESQDLLDKALRRLNGDRSVATAAEIVGQASDRVGSALHFLRLATRG